MVDVVALLEYCQELRHRYFDTLSDLSWEDVITDRGASFGSLRNIFLHCVEVLDLYGRLLRGETRFTRYNYDDFNSMEQINDKLVAVESKVNRYLSTVTPDELSRSVERKRRVGPSTIATVEDHLFNVFQEEIHHFGEFIALLWQMGVTPPHLGWTRYIAR
jgi:uncharacterized damage-inducible protein DinB